MADTVLVVKENELVRRHKAEHEPYEYYKMEITKRADFGQCYAAIYEIPPRSTEMGKRLIIMTESR